MVWTATRPKAARELRQLTNGENAWQAIAGLEDGGAVFGLTKGSFSLIDLIRALLDLTGPAALTVSTWTAAKKEIDDAADLLRDGRITGLRWLVDYSFPRRQPAYCDALRERFGDDAIRVTKNHAKFAIVDNGSARYVLRTSMNLNKNARLEYFEVEDSPELADLLGGVVDEVFREQLPGGCDRRPQDAKDDFARLGVVRDDAASVYGRDLQDRTAPGFGRLD